MVFSLNFQKLKIFLLGECGKLLERDTGTSLLGAGRENLWAERCGGGQKADQCGERGCEGGMCGVCACAIGPSRRWYSRKFHTRFRCLNLFRL